MPSATEFFIALFLHESCHILQEIFVIVMNATVNTMTQVNSDSDIITFSIWYLSKASFTRFNAFSVRSAGISALNILTCWVITCSENCLERTFLSYMSSVTPSVYSSVLLSEQGQPLTLILGCDNFLNPVLCRPAQIRCQSVPRKKVWPNEFIVSPLRNQRNLSNESSHKYKSQPSAKHSKINRILEKDS
jgi:hypothetical protein